MSYKAILFDLDGTLLNTIEDLGDSVNIVLANRGLEQHPMSDYISWVGNGAYNLIKRALPENLRNHETIDETVKEFFNTYSKNCMIKTKEYEGISNSLDELMRMNYILTVLSNKPHDFTVTMIKSFLNRCDFKVIYGEREGVPRKPDPTSSFEIAKTVNVVPEDFIYFGDSPTDMQTAIAAGMFPVGVLWGYRTKQQLLESGARHIIERPSEIVDIVRKLS